MILLVGDCKVEELQVKYNEFHRVWRRTINTMMDFLVMKPRKLNSLPQEKTAKKENFT